MTARRIGDVLVSRRVVTGAMLTAALGEAKRKDERICTVLLRNGVDEGRLAGALAELHGTPGVDLSRSVIPSEVLGLVPLDVARADLVLPLSREGGRVHVALATPESATVQIDEIRLGTGQEVSVYVAVHGAVKDAIEAAYASAARGHAVWRGKAATASGPHVERVQAVAFARPPAPTPAQRAAMPATPPASGAGSAIGRMRLEKTMANIPLAAQAAPPRAEPAEVTSAAPIPPSLPPGSEGLAEVELDTTDFGPVEALPHAAADAADAAEPPLLEAEPIEDEPVPRGDGRKLVLVVDDEPEVALLAQRTLEKAGYAVMTAGDGEAALAEAERSRPDLVLLDAMLPRLHGFEVCLRLRANPRTKHIPVVIMTAVYRGWRFADDAHEAYGAEDYIEKPFSLEDLRRRIEAALDRRGGVTRAAPAGFAEAYGRGRQAFRAGDHGAAVAAFEQALALDPFSPEAHAAIGVALRASGDRFRAMTMLERAVELRPHDLVSLQALANVYDRNGFFRKAIEALTRALAAAKDEQTRDALRAELMGRLDLQGATFGG